MKIRFSTAIRILFCMLILLSGAGCGRSLVRGRVIDDETGKPIEGAVYAIYWYRCRPYFYAPGVECDDIENTEGVTDTEGNFEVPKYPARAFSMPTFEMGVYKKGYVMWAHDGIFYPERDEEIKSGKRKPDDIFEYVKWHLKNGAVVRMRPWKEGYSEKRHAGYVCHFSNTLHSRLLDKAVISECKLQYGR